MPFYQKYADFSRVLPLNHQYLNKPHIEVILCLDEPSEESLVLRLLEQFPDIKWKVIVCRESHSWRGPCRAINVGIRQALGDYILVVSPESAFVGDLPSHMLMHVPIHPSSAICGRLHYSTFAELEQCEAPYQAMLRFLYRQGESPLSKRGIQLYYGSILVSREAAVAVCGYDECLTSWGGDDDNFRARLQMAGVKIVITRNVNILHLSSTPRPNALKTKSKTEEDYIFRPSGITCPNCSHSWGTAFHDIAFDWCTGSA